MGINDYKIGILGCGRALPIFELTNFALEEIVDTSDEWIQKRTGIKTRRIISEEESLLQLSYDAAKVAIDKAGINVNQIQYIRVGVNTHLKFPSLAAMVQKALGIKNSSAADISAGCAGFVFGVEDVFNSLRIDKLSLGLDGYGLIIGADVLSTVTDWTDRSTCVLFGDGAGAVVLGPVDSGEIMAIFSRTQGEFADLLYLDKFLIPTLKSKEGKPVLLNQPLKQQFLHMTGKKVFAVAVRSMMSDIKSVVAKYNHSHKENLTLADIDYVIPHQANLRIVKAVQEGLKLRKDQVYRDGVIKYGNTSAATIPIGYVDELGKRPGAIEIDVSFGSGFASGAILRRVAE
ncbi:beta-ketoacyl-ACP synthase 3 [bacterium]|nr:beta-ketoacyl-ACP synthase 3 [bacterium]